MYLWCKMMAPCLPWFCATLCCHYNLQIVVSHLPSRFQLISTTNTMPQNSTKPSSTDPPTLLACTPTVPLCTLRWQSVTRGCCTCTPPHSRPKQKVSTTHMNTMRLLRHTLILYSQLMSCRQLMHSMPPRLWSTLTRTLEASQTIWSVILVLCRTARPTWHHMVNKVTLVPFTIQCLHKEILLNLLLMQRPLKPTKPRWCNILIKSSQAPVLDWSSTLMDEMG